MRRLMARSPRPPLPRSPRGIVVFVILAALAAWRFGPSLAPTSPDASPPDATIPGAASTDLGAGPHRVERVVDGDTLLLENKARVRLIGVDAPESVKPDSPVEPFGVEAAEFTRQWIAAAGGQVVLEFDREPKDRYDRYLAYVWVDRRMLNEEILRAGLATALTQYPYSEDLKLRFLAAQSEAQAAGRGIWSRAAPTR